MSQSTSHWLGFALAFAWIALGTLPGWAAEVPLVAPYDSHSAPMPADVTTLDQFLASGSVALGRRILSAAPEDLPLQLNWERAHLLGGGGFIVAYLYLQDLWRAGDVDPANREQAGRIVLYDLTLVLVDGLRCDDQTAPGHRLDQLLTLHPDIVRYLEQLNPAARQDAIDYAIALEAATAPLRTDDKVLCSGGMVEIDAGLNALGNKPLTPMQNSNLPGKALGVPDAPGWAPKFVDPAISGPKQSAARLKLRKSVAALFGG